jgi:hypothetical protein
LAKTEGCLNAGIRTQKPSLTFCVMAAKADINVQAS